MKPAGDLCCFVIGHQRLPWRPSTTFVSVQSHWPVEDAMLYSEGEKPSVHLLSLLCWNFLPLSPTLMHLCPPVAFKGQQNLVKAVATDEKFSIIIFLLFIIWDGAAFLLSHPCSIVPANWHRASWVGTAADNIRLIQALSDLCLSSVHVPSPPCHLLWLEGWWHVPPSLSRCCCQLWPIWCKRQCRWTNTNAVLECWQPQSYQSWWLQE